MALAHGVSLTQEIFFLDAYERKQPMFTMTKDGYAFLVGKKPVVAGSIPRGDISGATDNPSPTCSVSVYLHRLLCRLPT
jgi:hypothetical protein